MLRFLTAGESHGKGLVVILEGMPAGLHLDLDAISEQLRRRQGGYGRGRRMAIESDQAEVLSGVRAAETLGSPIALLLRNRQAPRVIVSTPSRSLSLRSAHLARGRPDTADSG